MPRCEKTTEHVPSLGDKLRDRVSVALQALGTPASLCPSSSHYPSAASRKTPLSFELIFCGTTENQKIIWYLELGYIFNTNLKQLVLALESSGEHELSGLEETVKRS